MSPAHDSSQLRREHNDLLQAVADLQGDDDMQAPSTEDVGDRLLDILEGRDGSHQWISAGGPWHGTRSTIVYEVEALGLLELEIGVAGVRRYDQRVATTAHHFLSLTDRGREVLAAQSH